MPEAETSPSAFAHWDLVDRITMHEAAMLWLGKEPSAAGLDNPDLEYQTTRMSLIRAFQLGELRGVRCVENDWDEDAPVIWEKCQVFRQSLVELARKKGVSPTFLCRDLAALGAHEAPSFRLPMPCPDHILDWVSLMVRAYSKHWSKYNLQDTSSKRPSSDEVVDWLQRQKVDGKEVAPSVAKVLARMIRVPDAPMGRRPDAGEMPDLE